MEKKKNTNNNQLGGSTCLWALVIWFLLPDSPANARFLSHRERLLAVKRVAANEMGIKNKAFDKKQVWSGFTDPKTIWLFISVFAAYVSHCLILLHSCTWLFHTLSTHIVFLFPLFDERQV
jgi:hypothetical protein